MFHALSTVLIYTFLKGFLYTSKYFPKIFQHPKAQKSAVNFDSVVAMSQAHMDIILVILMTGSYKVTIREDP
jgi:hypothetical protein